jgi:hypothetical protein
VTELSRDAMLGRATPEQRASWWAGVRSVRMPRLVLWWALIAATYAGLGAFHGEPGMRAAWVAVWNWRMLPAVVVEQQNVRQP